MPHSEAPDLGASPTVLLEGPGEAFVVKPAGMSVELSALARGAADPSLLGWARRRWPRAAPRLPHRLDRIARGIVVVALTSEAAAFHSAMIAQRRWTKLYLARIDAGRVDPGALLGRHRLYLRTRGRRAEVVRSGGAPALLRVIALAAAPASPPARATGHAHALIELETGRFHQIRATLAHLGAPIAGDPLYDPRARGVERPPYLEHAALRLPMLGAADRTVWWPEDPQREPLDPALATALLEAVTRPLR